MKFFILILLLGCAGQRVPKSHSKKKLPLNTHLTTQPAPVAPSGFEVISFSQKMKKPVWAYETPGGDILIAEENQVSLLRDTDGDGKTELKTVFLDNQDQPFGMLILHNWFYVTTATELKRYQYQEGMTKISGTGEVLLTFPKGGRKHHGMRNIVSSLGHNKIYVAVGSSTDKGEHGLDEERDRATVFVMDTDGKNKKVFASGLRYPIGMDWHSHTGLLWVVVSERENIGKQKADDYLTVIKQGHFYGWPFYYWGKNPDPIWAGKIPKKLPRVAVPHLKLGSQAGNFGLTFYRGKTFGPEYRSGAFISQNNTRKVVFVPFSKGHPSGQMQDFLTGFSGRPAGVIELNRGDLLVCDDLGDAVWLIRSKDGALNY